MSSSIFVAHRQDVKLDIVKWGTREGLTRSRDWSLSLR